MLRKGNNDGYTLISMEDDFEKSSMDNEQKKERLFESPPLKYPDYSTHVSDKQPAEKSELHLQDVIQAAKFAKTKDWAKDIMTAFNAGNKESWVTDTWQLGYSTFGKAIPLNMFWLVERNSQPELVAPTQKLMRTKLYASGGTVIDHGYYPQTNIVIGRSGRYLVNIPQGKLAKAWVGMTPILLGEGSHVIRDANFRLATDNSEQPASSFVNMNAPYISHGNYHILRVPQGKVAKVWVNGQAVLLPARIEPYVFNDNTFKLNNTNADHFNENFEDISDIYIQHGNIHIIRVPQGKIGKVWINGEAQLLEPKSEAYEFNTPNFKLDNPDPLQLQKNFQNINDCYIHHGNHHILRVPQGKIAKIWLKGQALLLEASSKPYIYDDPTFQLDNPNPELSFVDVATPYIKHGMTHIVNIPKGKIAKITVNGIPTLLEGDGKSHRYEDPYFSITPKAINAGVITEPFFDAGEQLIVHGHLKRVMPRTGEVAITYNDGKLDIVDEYRLIESPKHIVKSPFFQTLLQTIVFPSEKTRKERESISKDSDYINYEQYRTSDGLPLGVNLVVVYSVIDPKKALSNFPPDDIVRHIEKIVEADMAQIVQLHKSTDFLNTNLRVNRKDDNSQTKTHSELPSAPLNLTEEITTRLTHDLEKYGIALNRLTIETPKILDKKVSEQMSNLAFTTIQNQANSVAAEQQLFLIRQNSDNARETTANEARLALTKKEAELQQAQKEFEIQKTKVETETTRTRLQAQAAAEAELTKVEVQIKIAEAEAKAAEIRARYKLDVAKYEAAATREKQVVELEKERAFGEILQTHPNLLQLEMTKSMSASWKGIQTMVISPEVANSVYGMGNSTPSMFTLFTQRPNGSAPTPINLTSVSNEQQPAVKQIK